MDVASYPAWTQGWFTTVTATKAVVEHELFTGCRKPGLIM
jgi:hypothetical protein